MTPEATFFTELASGRLPALAALICILVYIVHKGGIKLDKLTEAVQAVPAALAAHKIEHEGHIAGLRSHVTAETERVIKTVTDHRMSSFEETIEDVKRVVSSPDLEPQRGRSPTGRHAAIR